jgi:hypothetical protein
MTVSRRQPRRKCECGVMQHYVAEPDIPITFDAELNEYHIVYGDKPHQGSIIIHCCIFCGGRLPDSRRGELFAKITHAESRRLTALVGGLKSFAEIKATLGEPDFASDHGMGVGSADDGVTQPTFDQYPTMFYENLSPTVKVHFVDYGVHGVRFSLLGKELKKVGAAEASSPLA